MTLVGMLDFAKLLWVDVTYEVPDCAKTPEAGTTYASKETRQRGSARPPTQAGQIVVFVLSTARRDEAQRQLESERRLRRCVAG
jgi:hypothetical protein